MYVLSGVIALVDLSISPLPPFFVPLFVLARCPLFVLPSAGLVAAACTYNIYIYIYISLFVFPSAALVAAAGDVVFFSVGVEVVPDGVLGFRV